MKILKKKNVVKKSVSKKEVVKEFIDNLYERRGKLLSKLSHE